MAPLSQLRVEFYLASISLRRLEDVTLYLGSCPRHLLLAKSFMSLQSVNSLILDGNADSEIIQHFIEECFTLSEASSNVVNLQLNGDFTNRGGLSEILKGCRKLARLSVNCPAHAFPSRRHLCCSDIVAILSKSSAEHSLTWRWLNDDYFQADIKEDKLVDCTRFKNLRDFFLVAQCAHDKDNSQTVIGRLSQSLYSLSLYYKYDSRLKYERDSFRALENSNMT